MSCCLAVTFPIVGHPLLWAVIYSFNQNNVTWPESTIICEDGCFSMERLVPRCWIWTMVKTHLEVQDHQFQASMEPLFFVPTRIDTESPERDHSAGPRRRRNPGTASSAPSETWKRADPSPTLGNPRFVWPFFAHDAHGEVVMFGSPAGFVYEDSSVRCDSYMWITMDCQRNGTTYIH